jgi:hypothetical protein
MALTPVSYFQDFTTRRAAEETLSKRHKTRKRSRKTTPLSQCQFNPNPAHCESNKPPKHCHSTG